MHKTTINNHLVEFSSPTVTDSLNSVYREIWIIRIDTLPILQTGSPHWVGNLSTLAVGTKGLLPACIDQIEQSIDLNKLKFIALANQKG